MAPWPGSGARHQPNSVTPSSAVTVTWVKPLRPAASGATAGRGTWANTKAGSYFQNSRHSPPYSVPNTKRTAGAATRISLFTAAQTGIPTSPQLRDDCVRHKRQDIGDDRH